MNIFVLVKQVPDTETKVKFSDDKTSIDYSSIKWIINPYDEYAIEQALQIKAAAGDSFVMAVRVGSVEETEALRTAMAMGVDEAILVEAQNNLDSYVIAKALKKAIEKSQKKPDLILAGKQAIDSDCLQTPQLLAELMDLPSVSVVVGCEQQGNQLTLKREVEGGTLEIYDVQMPCVISCNKGLNTPRYPSLPGIMKAKKKPLHKYSLDELELSSSECRVVYSNFQYPPQKAAGKKFVAEEGKEGDTVKEVVGLLRNEAKVI